MPGPIVQGTFATGQSAVTAAQVVGGDVLCVPSNVTTMRLTTLGLDGSNQIKTRKRTAGGVFADQTTYNSDQTNVAVTVVPGEEWQVVQVLQQAIKDVRWKLSCES
jgi:hypothetical protein